MLNQTLLHLHSHTYAILPPQKSQHTPDHLSSYFIVNGVIFDAPLQFSQNVAVHLSAVSLTSAMWQSL